MLSAGSPSFSSAHAHDQRLNVALERWTAAIGADHVVTRDDVLRDAGTATLATRSRVLAILRPANRDEVQTCVRVANAAGIALYPLSTGKNWGYGSRAPVRDGVLLDLGRLNRILDFNEELAYVTVEPGVTQRQLFAFLRDRGSNLWMDATGASPDCSLVGNTVERGFGHTPMGDHAANVCGLEVVLPDGECLESGFARFPSSKAAAISRWGVGPSIDGLFSQSNLGIVTRMSIWLMPAPEYFQAFFFMAQGDDALARVVDALRPLRLDGTLRSVMHIGNDYKVLAGSRQFPWDDPAMARPIDRATMAGLRKSLGIGTWNGSGGLYGSRAQVREARRRVKAALAGKVDRLQFVDDRLLRTMARFATPFRMLTGWDVRHTLRVLEPVFNLMKGVPTEGPMASAYWRKRRPAPADADPDRDRCGLLWCSPVVPSVGRDLMAATGTAAELLLAHGFEPQISVSLSTERSSTCVITISYDRDEPGEDDRALACYRALTKRLLDAGYPPYRVNVSAMDLVETGGAYAACLHAIKQALDPNGILAPGRYEAGGAIADQTVRSRGVA
jgi:4-cresol dehydrogenase (hydroxylating)